MISQERQTHFAHVIIEGLWNDDLVDYDGEDSTRALRMAKRVIEDFVDEVDKLDDAVIAKLRSIQRPISEGGDEWNALYEKFYQEELRKRGL